MLHKIQPQHATNLILQRSSNVEDPVNDGWNMEIAVCTKVHRRAFLSCARYMYSLYFEIPAYDCSVFVITENPSILPNSE